MLALKKTNIREKSINSLSYLCVGVGGGNYMEFLRIKSMIALEQVTPSTNAAQPKSGRDGGSAKEIYSCFPPCV